MKNLVEIKGNDVFTDSLVIAEGTENTHHAVRVLIQKYEGKFNQLGKLSFKMRPLDSGQSLKVYDFNEPQATFLMTLLRNSNKVVDFKLRLTKEFYRMRSALIERSSTEWLKTRKQGKLIRRNETDVIAELIKYAEKQGSKNSKMLYVNYTKMVNRTVGINTGEREFASQKVLDTIAFIEDMALNTIRKEMLRGTYYKEIYKICKKNAEQIAQFAYLPEEKLLIS